MAGIGYAPREAGLLHRLDTGTSGLLIAARSRQAFVALRSGMTAGYLEKKYLAVVPSGPLDDTGVISGWLASHPRDRRRVAVLGSQTRLKGARYSQTEWRVVHRGLSWQLLEIHAGLAYRHQVRAHLAALGYPIAGDRLYGGAPVRLLRGRHALHASYVAWPGDMTIAAFAVEARLPTELTELTHSR
jgi:23S rRNA pseudouridine1911/1915/1917 synthase